MVALEKKNAHDHAAVARQAAKAVWTHEELLASLEYAGYEAELEIAKRAGIVDENGHVTPLYSEDWGDKVTRTFDYGAG